MLTTVVAFMMFAWPGHAINELNPEPYASMAECERVLSVFHIAAKGWFETEPRLRAWCEPATPAPVS